MLKPRRLRLLHLDFLLPGSRSETYAMKRCTLLSGLMSLATLVLLNSTSNAQDDGFKSIFNGKDLTGWEGQPELWSVQDGAITGTTSADAPIKSNTFLIWKAGELKDFELRLKFRIVDGNSGIQYRSTASDNYVVGGYQADIDATMRFMGILYEERGRGVLANRGKKVTIKSDGNKEETGQTCKEEELLASIKNEDWNEYVIMAKGNHLTQKINGHTTVDVTDEQSDKAKKSGVLAFQLHVGPPMIVQFKDILLKELK